MKKRLVFILSFIAVLHSAEGQDVTETITGQVSFRSSQHTYVRFRNTTGLNAGDTLFIQSGNTLEPALLVSSLSSTSCLCKPLTSTELPEGRIVIAQIRKTPPAENVDKGVAATPVSTTDKMSERTGSTESPLKTVFNGIISAASYSHFSNNSDYNQRFRYRLSGNATNIGGSKLSGRTYMTYTHRLNEDLASGSPVIGLRVYDLWIEYDFDSTASIKIGRQINPRMMSTGAFDGLVAQKSAGRFTGGITAGTTPDHIIHGFNPQLLQLGGYAAYDVHGKVYTSATSLAFVEHLNSGKTDRRYLYFQHSGSAGRSITYYGSAEADLFRSANESGSALTSAWLMVSLRLSQKISFNGSFDARKNPVWHETYKSFLDSLTDAELRQSLMLGTSFKLSRSVMAGLKTSARFVKSDNRQTANISGYLSWRSAADRISATLNGNYIETGFLKGMNAGLMLRSSPEKLQAGAGYTFQRYRFSEGPVTIQHTGRADLSWRLRNKTSMNADYEITVNEGNIFHQFYVQLSRRF